MRGAWRRFPLFEDFVNAKSMSPKTGLSYVSMAAES